ncbi:50S ribosomal protein L13 [Candidatus Dojkabacteria bacterium]|jgi:large subunit ribosomal protein L13|nr:50S ribosomal protein L13 [Candidatus Dojkabacteria bacterium]
MNTPWTKEKEITREWHLVDAKDQILGRVATRVASLLIGKGKVKMVPNLDCGDYVIVINAAGIKLTRGKETKKMYYRHSGYPGGFRETRFDDLIKEHPTRPIELAVKRMLPQNKMKSRMMARLFVYADSNHKQEAQKPKTVKL